MIFLWIQEWDYLAGHWNFSSIQSVIHINQGPSLPKRRRYAQSPFPEEKKNECNECSPHTYGPTDFCLRT